MNNNRLTAIAAALLIGALLAGCGTAGESGRMSELSAFIKAPSFSLSGERLNGASGIAPCPMQNNEQFFLRGQARGPFAGTFSGTGYFRLRQGGGFTTISFSIISGISTIAGRGFSPNIGCAGNTGQLPYTATLTRHGKVIASTSGFAYVELDLVHRTFKASF